MYTHNTHVHTHLPKTLAGYAAADEILEERSGRGKWGSVRDNLVRYLCLTWSSMVLRWLGFEFNLKPLPSYAFWISC